MVRDETLNTLMQPDSCINRQVSMATKTFSFFERDSLTYKNSLKIILKSYFIKDQQ